jgi:uncharacterized membrane protein HdeD (DUF308 family)
MSEDAAGANRWNDLRDIAAVLAGGAAFVYVTGGAALALRFGRIGLPSTVAVANLPREFLIAQGLLIVAPAGAVALAVWWRRRDGRATVAAAALVYLVIGALVVFKAPFAAQACLTDRSAVLGVIIGETGDRTYLGEPAGTHPRHIVSIPESQIRTLYVGGDVPRRRACPG